MSANGVFGKLMSDNRLQLPLAQTRQAAADLSDWMSSFRCEMFIGHSKLDGCDVIEAEEAIGQTVIYVGERPMSRSGSPGVRRSH